MRNLQLEATAESPTYVTSEHSYNWRVSRLGQYSAMLRKVNLIL